MSARKPMGCFWAILAVSDAVLSAGRRLLLGKMYLLDNGPRTASVIAETPVRLLGVTAWAFRSLLAQHPSITLKLLEEVAGRLRTASTSITA